MDIQEFTKKLASKQRELDQAMRRTLPIKVGNMAKEHFQENFRKGGFVNNGLNKWPETRRQKAGGKSASSRYGPLLSGRNHLFSSVKYIPSDYRVKVLNEVEYAPVHNWGGVVHPKVTPRMRKFAWAMYYKTAGIKKSAKGKKKGKKRRARRKAIPPEADVWKRLALTKKKNLSIRIPQRQFIGDSAELNEKVNNKIESELRKIIES